MKLPKRTKEHKREELSNRFFHQHLPENWTTTAPQHDYGVDLVVSIFDGEHASPYELHVQLKSSEQPTKGENEKVPLKITTYNHLKNILHVVMLVKYIETEKEAYWLLLIDMPEPNQDQKTFTVNIPKTNTLSSINWQEIETYIREIVDYKLTAGDAIRNKRKNQQ